MPPIQWQFHNFTRLFAAGIMEYFPLGSLNLYLQKAKEAGNTIPAVDLVEAGTTLASALHHLDNLNVVHGNIRCRKLYVTKHQPGERLFTSILVRHSFVLLNQKHQHESSPKEHMSDD